MRCSQVNRNDELCWPENFHSKWNEKYNKWVFILVERFNSIRYQFEITSFRHSFQFRVSIFCLSHMFLVFWMCVNLFDWTLNFTFSVMIFVSRIYTITELPAHATTLQHWLFSLLLFKNNVGVWTVTGVWDWRSLSHMDISVDFFVECSI